MFGLHCVSRAIKRGCVRHWQWRPSNRSIRTAKPEPAGDGPVVLMVLLMGLLMVVVCQIP